MVQQGVSVVAQMAEAFAIMATFEQDGFGGLDHDYHGIEVGSFSADSVTEADVERLKALGWKAGIAEWDGKAQYSFTYCAS